MSDLILPGQGPLVAPDPDDTAHQGDVDAHHAELHEASHRSGGGDELSHANLAALTTGDPHTQYVLESNLAWGAWSPSYTNLTVGNGTVVARYAEVGKLVVCYFDFVLGSTSSVGSTPTISTPVTGSSNYDTTWQVLGPAIYREDGVDVFMGFVRFQTDRDTFRPLVYNSSGTYLSDSAITATVPHTWGTGDRLYFQATYEGA